MPYISQNFINDLPNQIDIVDLIAKRVVLKKTGDGYRGACPFHGGKNSNFSVSAQKQFYHCFKCGESGGAISFVQKYDNLDFVEAVETIANEFGLAIEYNVIDCWVFSKLSSKSLLLGVAKPNSKRLAISSLIPRFFA
jgi:DNA primase